MIQNISEQLTKWVKEKQELIYLFFVAIGSIYSTTRTSEFSPHLITLGIKGLLLVGVLFCTYRIFMVCDYSKKQKILIGLALGFLFINSRINKDGNFVYFITYVIASKGISLNKINNWVLYSLIATVVLIIYLCNVDLVVNITTGRGPNKPLREALGFSYAMLLSSNVFFINASITVKVILQKANRKLSTLLWILLVAINSYWSYYLTDTRTDLICNVFLFVILVTYIYFPITSTIFKKAIVWVPFGVFFWTIYSAVCFNPKDKFWLLCDKAFSGRLHLVHTAFLGHTPKLFGQVMKEQGLGGVTKPIKHYFYIDSSFSRILFFQGIIIFMIVMYLLMVSILKLVQHNYLYLALIVLVIVLEGVSADHVMYLNDIGLYVLAFGLNLKNRRQSNLTV